MKKIRMLAVWMSAVILLESTGWTGLQSIQASQADDVAMVQMTDAGTTEIASEADADQTEMFVWTNPLLSTAEQAACEQQLDKMAEEDSSAVDATGISTYSSITSAGKYLRKQLKARASTISFQFDRGNLSATSVTTIYNRIWEEALKPTSDPQEGDYIRYHLARIQASTPTLENGACLVTYKMYCSYRTTASQESQVAAQIKSIVTSLNLVKCSDTEKVKRIHDYLCENMKYDYSYKNYTAYGMLVKKTAVCQGYATAFYALCIQAGLSVRCVPGIGYPNDGSSGNHMWNIVKIGSKWYNIDVTWDDQSSGIVYDYFLKNNTTFGKDHMRFYYYDSASQLRAYYTSAQVAAFNLDCPMSSVSYSGSVGKPSLKSVVSTGYNSVKLKWNKVDTATGYYVYYATSQTALSSCSPVVIKGGNVTSLKVAGLVPGQTYYFKMRAYSNLFTSVKSKYSTVISQKPMLSKVVLNQPTSSNGKVKVSWAKVNGATGYRVTLNCKKGSKNYTKNLSIAAGTAATQKVTLTGISVGTACTISIRACITKSDGKQIYGSKSAIKTITVK